MSEPTKQEKEGMAQAYRERAKEDLELCDAMNHGPEIRYLKSCLQAASELVEKWKVKANVSKINHNYIRSHVLENCARELEAALPKEKYDSIPLNYTMEAEES